MEKKKQTEEQICKNLGDPKTIAKEFKTTSLVKEAEKDLTFSNVMRVILATVGLGFFNLVFVLGPFIGAIAVLFSFFITAFAIVISGFSTIFAVILSPMLPMIEIGINPTSAILFGISSICGGSLMAIATYYLSKLFLKLTIKYIKLNFNIITKGE